MKKEVQKVLAITMVSLSISTFKCLPPDFSYSSTDITCFQGR